MSPKEIAERILEPSEERNSLIWEQIQNLARAYLELEDQLERVNGVIPQRDRFAHKIDDLQSEIARLKEETEQLLCQQRESDHFIMNLQLEITNLKEELAAEKADKQRVLDIGVKMQREVNDRLEAKNASLIEALEHIASPKHWAVDTFVPEIRDRVKISRDALKKWGGV